MAGGMLLILAAKVAEAIAVDFVKDKVLDIVKNPVKTYEDALRDCIYETIEEFHKKSKKPEKPTDKFPFYHSQDLMIALTQFMLLEDNSKQLSVNDFEKNPHVVEFTNKEVQAFYNLFLEKATSNKVLKDKFIEENYKNRIFENSKFIIEISEDVKEVKKDTTILKDDTKDIKKDTSRIIQTLKESSLQREPNKELSAKLPLLFGSKVIKREKDLKDVRERLLNNKQVVLVNGMGGIGKTTLAQLYITEFYNDYKYLLWINAGSDNFINDFNSTKGLGENLNVSLEGKTPDQFFVAVITALKNLSHDANQQSLLIIDNAEESIAKYKDYFPHPPNWHVLATSRANIKDFNVKELDFLNEEEAVELFKLHYKRTKISEDDIKEIVKTLEYHTLTIEILAKTAQNDRLDVQETVNTITKDYDVDIDARHSDEKIRKITSYLSSIFDLSKLSEEEIWLLKQFYFLPPQFHIYEVIEKILGEAIVESSIKLQRLLTKLVAKGWLLYNEELESYRLHRIIADVLQHELDTLYDEIEPLIDSISSLLHIDRNKDNPIHKFPWVIYGKYLLKHLDIFENPVIPTFQNNLSKVLKDLGDFQGAKSLLERVIVSYEKNFGKDHFMTLIIYSDLAIIFQRLGDLKEAKTLLERVVNTAEVKLGKKHPHTAIYYSNLATVIKDLGDYQGAKNLIEKAMKSDEKNFGKDHPNTSVRYSNLGTILHDLGDSLDAKVLLEKAVESNEKNFGKDHPRTTVSYSNLGNVLVTLGDYQGAKTLLKKAVESDKKNFGKNHPRMGTCYSNLALVMRALGDYQGAKSYLEKAKASDEENFGTEHPSTAVSYSNLGLVLQDLGDYQGAKSYLEKAAKVFQEILGDEHPNTITVKESLQYLLDQMNNKKGN